MATVREQNNNNNIENIIFYYKSGFCVMNISSTCLPYLEKICNKNNSKYMQDSKSVSCPYFDDFLNIIKSIPDKFIHMNLSGK